MESQYTGGGGGQQETAHDNLVSYFAGQSKLGNKSVNYLLSDKKITMMVNPNNVAWCSQSGNPTTISVETEPGLSNEGYKKMGWLINQLEERYGRGLTLYPHSHWIATACPGYLDVARMRVEANKWKLGGIYNPKITVNTPPAPVPTPTKPVIEWVKLPAPTKYIANKNTNLWNFGVTKWLDMTAVKPFAKGEEITIYGMGINKTLNATYLVTQYSFTKQITNGFNKVDMDFPPTPVPIPPPAQQPQPLPPTAPAPIPPTLEQRVTMLEKIAKAIANALGIKWE